MLVQYSEKKVEHLGLLSALKQSFNNVIIGKLRSIFRIIDFQRKFHSPKFDIQRQQLHTLISVI